MENQRCDGGNQASLGFKCKKSIPDGEKCTSSSPPLGTKIESKKALEDTNVGIPTPPQIIQPSRAEQKGTSVPLRAAKQIFDFYQVADVDMSSALRKIVKIAEAKLPEKYVAFAVLFNRMDASIRLLNLQKKIPTFSNSSLQVELLSKRKFTYQHLAQMKYLFPEAVIVEKILVHDKHTLCMKPDLKISLVHVVEFGPDEPSQPPMLLPTPVTTSTPPRQPHSLSPPNPPCQPHLLYPALPAPHHSCPPPLPPHPCPASLTPPPPHVIALFFPPSLSLVHPHSPSFPLPTPWFALTRTFARMAKAPAFSSSQLLEAGGAIDIQDLFKEFSSGSTVNSVFENSVSPPNRVFDGSPCNPTSTKLALTPVVETPNIQVSKRPVLTPNDCINTVNSSSYHSSSKRLLDFSTPTDVPRDDLIYFSDENRAGKASDHAKILEGSEEDPMMIQTGTGMKSQMSLTCLLDLVNVIQLFFQKAKFTFITKQSLCIRSIIWHCCERTDKERWKNKWSY